MKLKDLNKAPDGEKDEKKEKIKKWAGRGLVMALLLIIILLLLHSCKKEEPVNSHSVTVDTSATDKIEKEADNPLKDRNVYFSGIVDSKISKTGSIQLLNDEKNEDFYMQFSVYDSKGTDQTDDDEIIYDSDLVPSGKAIYWVPGEYLESGTYDLIFKETPYYFFGGTPETDPDSYITLSVGNNTVTITIL